MSAEQSAATVTTLHRPAKPEPTPFGPGSALWDDFGDILGLSTTLGAFMLQAMHPVISAGVDDFSTFRIGLFGLDKLTDVDGTVERLRVHLDQLAGG